MATVSVYFVRTWPFRRPNLCREASELLQYDVRGVVRLGMPVYVFNLSLILLHRKSRDFILSYRKFRKENKNVYFFYQDHTRISKGLQANAEEASFRPASLLFIRITFRKCICRRMIMPFQPVGQAVQTRKKHSFSNIGLI